MEDDASLALALSLSLNEAQEQHDSMHHPAQLSGDTSRDEELARQLQGQFQSDPSLGSDLRTFQPAMLPDPHTLANGSQDTVLGRAPRNLSTIWGGLKNIMKDSSNNLQPGPAPSHPPDSSIASGSESTTPLHARRQPSRASGSHPQATPLHRPPVQLSPSAGPATKPSDACAGCGQSIRMWQSSVSAANRRYHEWCFLCSGCQKPLPQGTSFALGSDGGLYHYPCHRQKLHPRCTCCGDFLPQDADGTIRFKHQPFWRMQYCAHHESDGTPRCHACSRLQPQDGSGWVGIDGRHSCLDCLTTMVHDTSAAQPLYDDVMRLYASFGMPLPTRPPLILVESAALNEAASREQHTGQGGLPRADGPQFHTRGLCLSEEWRTTKTVFARRQPGTSWMQALPSSMIPPRLEQLESSTWNVTAILVLCALPRLLTGTILAHEVMHAWLRLSGYPQLPLELEEGLAQLMALLWLERQCPVQGSFEERLQSHLGEQIRSDTSVVYGDGFRSAHHSFQRLDGNLAEILAHVKRTKQLP